MEELTSEQALRVAARDGDSVTVIRLLDAGTPVDAADMIGYTPLMLAARKDQTDMLRLLIERGADWRAKNRSGDTALDFAVGSGSVDSVQLLLDLEGEIKGWRGRQLLNSTSHADVKQVLFDAGASNAVAHLDRDEEQAINRALENDETVLCKVCHKPLAYYRYGNCMRCGFVCPDGCTVRRKIT